MTLTMVSTIQNCTAFIIRGNLTDRIYISIVCSFAQSNAGNLHEHDKDHLITIIATCPTQGPITQRKQNWKEPKHFIHTKLHEPFGDNKNSRLACPRAQLTTQRWRSVAARSDIRNMEHSFEHPLHSMKPEPEHSHSQRGIDKDV